MRSGPAPSNDFTLRREAVATPLSRLVDGEPGLLISPTCTSLRKAMGGGYCYKRIQVSGMSESDLTGYDTIIVDTVGRQLDSITAYLAANDPKMVRRTGELTLQGYGALKGVFNSWLRRTMQIGKDI